MLPSITRAPDISNFFLFPLKVQIIGILLYVYKQISIFHLFIYVSIKCLYTDQLLRMSSH